MATLPIVEHLDVVEDVIVSSSRVFRVFRLSSSFCMLNQNVSIIVLSNASPTEPNDGMSPASQIRSE